MKNRPQKDTNAFATCLPNPLRSLDIKFIIIIMVVEQVFQLLRYVIVVAWYHNHGRKNPLIMRKILYNNNPKASIPKYCVNMNQ